MKNSIRWRLLAAGTLASVSLAGCVSPAGTTTTTNGQGSSVLQDELAQSRAENQRLRTQVNRLQTAEPRVVERVVQVSAPGSSPADLPPANPGECYARVLIPAQYETRTEEVITREAGERIEVIPAEYDWVEETILVQDAGEEVVEILPAEYDWVEETIMVKEASQEVTVLPAQYETVQEEILVRPAYSVWKPGRGPIERLDNATGEIMCRVEVPAEYKTVTREVLVQPETTQVVEIPAEYDVVRKRVMVRAPEVIRREVAAEYETVRKQVVVRPAQEVRIPIPAEYGSVTQEAKVSDSFMDWRPIICETNMTPGLVENVQRALNDRGYSAGPVDGVIGRQTVSAIRSYQRDNSLAEGGLTVETINHLGVPYTPTTSY